MSTLTKTHITEITYQPGPSRVDEDAGILYGVKFVGMESRNGRRYTKSAMKKAVRLYDNRKIYLDHPSRDRANAERSIKDWIGESRNPEVRADGIYGDVHLLKKTDHFEGIIEAAEKFPKAVGFSHVADGESRMEGDTEIIESITEVFSVDLVTDPATTAGIFESGNGDGTTADIASVKEVIKTYLANNGPLEDLHNLCRDILDMAAVGEDIAEPDESKPTTSLEGFDFRRPGSWAGRYR